MSWIKDFLFVTFVTILSFEGLSFLATKLDLFLINETPLLYDSSTATEFQDLTYYGRTERDKWGAWHVHNATFRHRKSCFDVTMSFNEIGARDENFNNVPSSSLFLLGDSFAEGFGVDREEMSENLIEKKLNLSILNFGSAFNFGPLQQLIIYNEFKKFPHQGLIIYFLPSNDFTDNDSQIWKKIDQSRYRPYFNSVGDPVVPFYFPNAIPRDNFASEDSSGFKLFIKNNFWLSNALRSFLMIIRDDAFYSKDRKDITKSFYHSATELQQSNLVRAYEAILDSAGKRNVLFVVIPGINDIKQYQAESIPYSYHNTLWYQSFTNFKKRSEQRVEVLDLMEYLPEVKKDLFFECDDHWHPTGNRWAADVISNFIKEKNLFEIKN